MGVIRERHDEPMDDLAVLLELARRQFGTLSTNQAASVGFGEHDLRHLCAKAVLRRAEHGVYVVGGSPVSFEQQAWAALLACGPDALLSHYSAALLWEFPNVLDQPPLHVLVERGRIVRRSGIAAHRTKTLPTADRTTRSGVPVTSAARTLVDLSGWMSVGQIARALDDGIRRGVLGLRAVARCVSRLQAGPGRRTSVVRMLLDERLERFEPGESALESRIHRAIVEAGLPEPVAQHEVSVAGSLYRIDFAYPDVMLGIEVDGFDVHRVRTAFDHDRRRSNALQNRGWRLLHFTSAHSDGEVARTVGAALRQAHEPLARTA